MMIKKAMVVGAGLMGTGIAQVALQSGYDVILYDVNQVQLENARIAIQSGLLSSAKYSVQKSLIISTSLEIGSDVDIVIEAIPEKMSLKKDLFEKLDKICHRSVLATNTSTLWISEIAAATTRPDQVIGMHFASPVPKTGVVEIIRGIHTSDLTTEFACQVVREFGKSYIIARKDYPGFLLNRIWTPMVNEAIFAVMEGIGTPEEIDTGFRLAFGHRMGPLETIDAAGLDVALAAMEGIHEGLGDSKYRPCPLLKQMVKAGQLGKKSGIGFYKYENGVKVNIYL